ncbi:hypothetical protein TcWFU_001059 [Taenia crassiceps]|uniref:Uncharacterized protein n=1 Tax=Taenia crassiceps TaxID=6207 RepID=A0ABR4Q3Q8_9CEST
MKRNEKAKRAARYTNYNYAKALGGICVAVLVIGAEITQIGWKCVKISYALLDWGSSVLKRQTSSSIAGNQGLWVEATATYYTQGQTDMSPTARNCIHFHQAVSVGGGLVSITVHFSPNLAPHLLFVRVELWAD